MKNKLFSFFFLILLLSIASFSAGDQSRPSQERFLSIADIHFDPLAGCQHAKKPCPLALKLMNASASDWQQILEQDGASAVSGAFQETNYPLLKSTLMQLEKINQQQHPRFGLILGDFLEHDNRRQYILYSGDRTFLGYQLFVKKTLQFMTDQFHVYLPKLEIYPVIGNNDSYSGDYRVVPDGKFLHDTASTWAGYLIGSENRASILRDFPTAGYYAVTVPGSSTDRILLLDTVLFSKNAKGKKMHAAADQELVWLDQQLKMASRNKQHVLLAFHIPSGIDINLFLKHKFDIETDFWQTKYVDAVANIVKHYPSVVTGMLTAHVHVEFFQFIKIRPIGNVLARFTPSISPIFGNNPAMKLFTITPDWHIGDPETYFLRLDRGVDLGWQQE